MFTSKASILALVVAATVFLAAPIAIASKNANNSNDDHDKELVTVSGNVTALKYKSYWNYSDDGNRTREMILNGFVIDNETMVTFGPWWYWMVQDVTVADVVHLNDTVNVTGVLEEEDGKTVLCAWSIENSTTGDELTIREEGRPPWAGGPQALGIDPWPANKRRK